MRSLKYLALLLLFVFSAAFAQVNVRSFGAKGDGTTDDTTAIQKAMDSAAGPVVVLFPPGTYKFSQLTIKYSGLRLAGFGRKATILKTSAASGIAIQTLAVTQGGASRTNVNDLTIQDMTINYNSLASSTANSCIYLMQSYNNLLMNLDISANGTPTNPGIQTTSAAWAINLADGVYTTTLVKVDTDRISMAPSGSGGLTGTVNAIAFVGGSYTMINIAGNGNTQPVLNVSFTGMALQGASASGFPAAKIQINYAGNITFTGNDFEGDAGNTLFTIGHAQNVLSQNNNLNTNPGGAPTWPGTYYTDSGNNRLVQLLDQMDSPWVAAPARIPGEIISSLNQSGTASGTAANLTSIALTPGDWDIYAGIGVTGGAPQITNGEISITTTSATMNGTPGYTYTSYYVNNSAYGGATLQANVTPSVNTTYYLVHDETGVGVGTATMKGSLWAKRRR